MSERNASDRHAPERPFRGSTGSQRCTHTRRVSLGVDVDAAAQARRVVGEVAAGLQRRDDIMLATSELVTNVVRHAPRADVAELVANRHGRTVRVSVHQAKGSSAPLRRGDGGVGGFGLAIVDAVSDRWGVEDDGTVAVWFEMTG